MRRESPPGNGSTTRPMLSRPWSFLGKHKKLFTEKIEVEGDSFAAVANLLRNKDVPSPPSKA